MKEQGFLVWGWSCRSGFKGGLFFEEILYASRTSLFLAALITLSMYNAHAAYILHSVKDNFLYNGTGDIVSRHVCFWTSRSFQVSLYHWITFCDPRFLYVWILLMSCCPRLSTFRSNYFMWCQLLDWFNCPLHILILLRQYDMLYVLSEYALLEWPYNMKGLNWWADA